MRPELLLQSSGTQREGLTNVNNNKQLNTSRELGEMAASSRGWLMPVLLLLLHVMHSANAQPCARSGYCSVGKLKPYIGDISNGVGKQQSEGGRGNNTARHCKTAPNHPRTTQISCSCHFVCCVWP